MSKHSDQTETAPTGDQAPIAYPGDEPRASDSVLAAARMRVTGRYSGAADDLRLADEMLAQARTKQLPSTRTEIGAGGELIDREKVGSYLVDTVAHPDYVTAEASSDRLALASQAGSLSLCARRCRYNSGARRFGENVSTSNGGATLRHDEGYSPNEQGIRRGRRDGDRRGRR